MQISSFLLVQKYFYGNFGIERSMREDNSGISSNAPSNRLKIHNNTRKKGIRVVVWVRHRGKMQERRTRKRRVELQVQSS